MLRTSLSLSRATPTPTLTTSGALYSGKPSFHPAFTPVATPMLPEDSFKGKKVLVTGGGTGLGRAMTENMCRLGADVVITSRKTDVIEKTAAEITAAGTGNVYAVAADVRDIARVQEAIDESIELLGGLPDIVVNNAAGNFISPTERLSANAFKTIIDIVLQGTINVTLDVGKRLIKEGKGASFLSISTTYASTGSGFVVPSACAKAGVEAMTRSLAAEWGRYGMRFNAIAPGPIETKGAFSRLDPTGKFKQHMINSVATHRLGEPEELANMATYLVSPYASWMTGQVVTLDGGERAMQGEFNALLAVKPEEWDMIESQVRSVNKKGS